MVIIATKTGNIDGVNKPPSTTGAYRNPLASSIVKNVPPMPPMMATSVQFAPFGLRPRFKINGSIATAAGKERKKPTSKALKFCVMAARVDTRYEPQIRTVRASAPQAKSERLSLIK